MNWLLLLHQIPPQPSYFRAKVLRRLNQIGALAIKNSAYLLPASDEGLEDLQWVRQEIEREGGEAWLFRVESLAGLSDDSIREAFRTLREPDYKELSENARSLLERVRKESSAEINGEGEWRKLAQRFEEISKLDFFQAAGRKETETLMETIGRLLHKPRQQKETKLRPRDVKGCTWVTRKGVKVDRIASAWLIHRFIDPAARFSFVDAKTYKKKSNDIRFDMFEGEFTHEDNLCTFEVLAAWGGVKDRGLKTIAEVVHDIDLKDARYGHEEAPGIARLIDGITLRHADDAKRLEEGFALFDNLYAQFRRGQ